MSFTITLIHFESLLTFLEAHDSWIFKTWPDDSRCATDTEPVVLKDPLFDLGDTQFDYTLYN